VFAFSPESVARPSEATGGGAERGSSRESSERRAFPCATGAARGGECARATRRRRREARADECVAFRENRRCLGTDEKGSGEKTPEAARNESPEPDRARRRAGILTSPSLASRGNVTVYDSGNERSLSGRTDALEPGTTSQQRASPSRVDRTRAPRPRRASRVPSSPSAAGSQHSPTRDTVTTIPRARSCHVRAPDMPGTATLVGGSLGFAMQMYINALRKLPLLRSASPPLARRPSRIPRAPLAPRKFLTRAPIRPFRVCSPPRARRAASRSSARDAFVRATPGPRRPARRPADLARRAAPLTPRPAPHIIVSCLLFPNTTRRPLGARLLGGRGRRGGELERGVGGETSRGGGRAQRGEASDEREVHGVHRQGQMRRGPRASASPGVETATERKAATFKGTSPRDGEASNRHEAASRRRAGVRVGRKRARAAARCNCNAKER